MINEAFEKFLVTVEVEVEGWAVFVFRKKSWFGYMYKIYIL